MEFIQRFTLFVLICASLISVANCDPLQWIVTETRLPTPVSGHSAVYDGNDKIHVIGGSHERQCYPHHYVYDYSLSTSKLGLWKFMHIHSGAAFFDSGNIYYLGGSSTNNERFSNITRYTTKTGAWDQINNLPEKMWNLASSSVWNPVDRVFYTFGGWNGGPMDTILQYNPASNTIEQVASLPDRREGSAAMWSHNKKKAYIFGGYNGTGESQRDIFEFDPTAKNVTRLQSRLPRDVLYSCAAVESSDHAYMLHRFGLMRFKPEEGWAEEVPIDTVSWPESFRFSACVYIPKFGRIYVLGGRGQFPGEEDRYMDEISYIQLDNEGAPSTTTIETPPIDEDCSDGVTKIIPKPDCCTSFILCQSGEGTVFHCTDGQQFNPITFQCNDKEVVKCRNQYG